MLFFTFVGCSTMAKVTRDETRRAANDVNNRHIGGQFQVLMTPKKGKNLKH